MKNKPYSYNTYGTISELEDINGKSLYDYYNKVLKEDQIDIFVLGDINGANIKEIFKEYFRVNTFKKVNKNIVVPELDIRKRIVRYREYDDVNQAQLLVLCSLNGLSDFERKYTIKLYNELLGGSSNSILFETVREKNSYCYYINSSVRAYDNILIINSGVDVENIDKCIKLIKKCLKNIGDGKFKDTDIDAAKNTIISAIKSSLDEPMGIINTHLSKVLVGTEDNDIRIEKFSKLTKEDIVKISKKINLHTVLTLEKKGDEHGED